MCVSINLPPLQEFSVLGKGGGGDLHRLSFLKNVLITFLCLESFIEEVEAEEQEDGEGPQARWEELPVEVWQLIFQRVPLLDLVTSGRRVCQRWNQIITDDSVCYYSFTRGKQPCMTLYHLCTC